MGVRVAGIGATTLLLLSATAFAQIHGVGSASLPSRPEISTAPPDRQVLSQPPVNPDHFGARPDTYVPGHARRPRPGMGYPPFYGYVDDGYRADEHQTRTPEDRNGFLALDLKPGSAQVFIDGIYAGSVDDVRRVIPGWSLPVGVHRVELRAPGYDTAAFDVRIFPGETTSYRRDLDLATRPAQPPTPPAASPRTFYVIPSCYAGDRPPVRDQLRQGCDPTKLRTIPPVVSSLVRASR